MKKIIEIFLSFILLLFVFGTMAQAEVKIKWLGHSCFLLTSPGGLKILLDPYEPKLGYPFSNVSAELVLLSHEHFDHNYYQMASGKPKVLHGVNPETGKAISINETVQDVKIYSVKSYHDANSGKDRGENAIMVIDMPGMRFVHLGDLGTILSEDQVQKLGKVDVLMIPVGGTYTIDAKQANKVVEQLKPKIIFPMHYKTPVISLPLSPVDDFLSGKNNVERVKGNEYVIKEPPAKSQIIVLDWK